MSPFCKCPVTICKISCLPSEKSENVVQTAHKFLRTYLSGQFLRVHLIQIHTEKNIFEVWHETNNITIFTNNNVSPKIVNLALPSLASTFAKMVRILCENSSAKALFFDTDTPPLRQSNCCSIQAWKRTREEQLTSSASSGIYWQYYCKQILKLRIFKFFLVWGSYLLISGCFFAHLGRNLISQDSVF